MIYCCIYFRTGDRQEGTPLYGQLEWWGRKKLPPLYPFPTPTLNDILLYISELETVKKGHHSMDSLNGGGGGNCPHCTHSLPLLLMIYCCIFQNWRPSRRGHHSMDSLNGGGGGNCPHCTHSLPLLLMIYCCIFQNWRPLRRGHHSTDSLNGRGGRNCPHCTHSLPYS